MVRMKYDIVAMTENGVTVPLVRDIGDREEAKTLLAKVVREISVRKTKYVSLGDVVFDPMSMVAYVIKDIEIWEKEDCACEMDMDEMAMDITDVELTVTEPAPEEGPLL